MIKNQHQMRTASILMTLVLVGCAGEESPKVTNTATPSASPETVSQQTRTPASQGQEKSPGVQTQPFDTPLVAASPKPNMASLTLPTNKDERLNIIPTGRPDPFGQIYEPIVPISQSNTSSEQEKVPVLPPLPTVKKPVATVKKPVAIKPPVATVKKPVTIKSPVATVKKPVTIKSPVATVKKPVAIKLPAKPVLPKLISPIMPPVVIKPELPPAPQPDAAKSVVVSGVILIGKVPQVIIKVPDEPNSRYVQPGQRLVNGVLIKRVEMSDGANPVVILEQYGIEVAKQVGEKSVEEKDKDGKSTNTAAVEHTSQQTVLGVL